MKNVLGHDRKKKRVHTYLILSKIQTIHTTIQVIPNLLQNVELAYLNCRVGIHSLLNLLQENLERKGNVHEMVGAKCTYTRTSRNVELVYQKY